MTIFSVRHSTIYHYTRDVGFGEHRLMFRPRDSFDQRLLQATLKVDPAPSSIRWMHDVFGNCVALVQIAEPARELRFETTIRLDHTPQVPLDLRIDEEALAYPFNYAADEIADLTPTITPHYVDEIDELRLWSRQFVKPGQRTGHLLMTLCAAIQDSFLYSRRLESGTQSPVTTLRLRCGTCRDFALLMMEAARGLGFAARFVTGYLYVPDRDEPVLQGGGSTQPAAQGGGSTHAWCQIYLPGAGWVEFDPTNGIVGNRDLIRVAVARDPSQAVPLSGTYSGSPDDYAGMTVQVNVTISGDEDSSARPARDGTHSST